MKFGLRHFLFLLFFGTIILLCQCQQDNAIFSLDERIEALTIELQDLPAVVHPIENPSTPEKITLGKLLFWDPIISGDKDIACATCHHPAHGYADGLDLSIGVGGSGLGPERTEIAGGGIPRIGRGAPTIINSAYIGMKDHHQIYMPENAPMFWDSRVESLENQCLQPPATFNEMMGNAYTSNVALDSVLARLAAIPAYVALFDSAFGGGSAAINADNFGKAIASFERTIISNNSPYDKYVAGDLDALDDDQKKGLLFFFNDGNCALCHKGPTFSDWKLTVHGAQDNKSGNFPDFGANNAYQFKTPTLRNIELTAPYTHGGMYNTLEEALGFYNTGESDNPNVSNNMLDDHIEKINLTDEQLAYIIEFLRALTDDSFDKTIPASVPSGLNPGGNI